MVDLQPEQAFQVCSGFLVAALPFRRGIPLLPVLRRSVGVLVSDPVVPEQMAAAAVAGGSMLHSGQ